LSPDGKQPCLKFQDGRCDDPNCPRFHGPFTKAQQKAFTTWKAAREARQAAAASGADTGGEEAAPAAKPKAKAKPKP